MPRPLGLGLESVVPRPFGFGETAALRASSEAPRAPDAISGPPSHPAAIELDGGKGTLSVSAPTHGPAAYDTHL